MRLSKHWRPLHIYWDFNGDGRFSKERIKGKDKYFMKRRRRSYEKNEARGDEQE